MKYFFTFLLFFCVFISKGQSGNYIDSTSTWYEFFGAIDGINIYKDNNRYFIDGDTTISGTIYHKLYWDKLDSIFDAFTDSFLLVNFYQHVYQGGLREDTLKRFYFYYPGQSSESLLFDFNLNVGSALPNMISNYGCVNPPYVIQSIDTIYLGSTIVKHFNLPPAIFNKSLYEGIGASGGFIWQGSLCTMFESGACLIAYKKGNDSLFINNCGQAITALSETSKEGEVKIYPNPAHDEIRVQLDTRTYKAYQVIDDKGIEKLRGNIDTNGLTIISLRGLKSGHYTITLKDVNGREISRKIVKM
ncbi:MAG TPA: T9SS type A sorting domain-containing protein [Bacteroidia bacterium]|jgi:hypothetical protein|nr:T9SS type A sorting domain-containing protein [Bacteroidia bacterium]HQF27802.1 T9SS type A sorting domain-containing protein [Bacteroidia bacterium]HQK97082.1 T9SS type A sorting domain-containing protein [Bacteroidia bacterium]